jgi:hypothetical protein
LTKEAEQWTWQCSIAASGVMHPKFDSFTAATELAAAADLVAPAAAAAASEPEFALWLEAIANGGSYEQLADALTAMAGELNAVRSSTLQLVERFFKCVFVVFDVRYANDMSCCVVFTVCAAASEALVELRRIVCCGL